MIWNVIVAGLLIHFGSDYLIRFYLTFGLMVLIAVTIAFKVFISMAYYIYYKLCVNTKGEVSRLNCPSLYEPFKRSEYNKKTRL